MDVDGDTLSESLGAVAPELLAQLAAENVVDDPNHRKEALRVYEHTTSVLQHASPQK